MDNPRPHRDVAAQGIFREVHVEVRVCVGTARPKIQDLLALGPNAVVPLDKSIEDPVELYIGERLIARGYLEEVESSATGQIAVRLTEVAAEAGKP